MFSFAAMFAAIWKSARKPLMAAKAQGIGLIPTVATLPPAIMYLGIDGAAIVSIVVYGVVALWLWRGHPFAGLLASRAISEFSEYRDKESAVNSYVSHCVQRSTTVARHKRDGTTYHSLAPSEAELVTTGPTARPTGLRHLPRHSPSRRRGRYVWLRLRGSRARYSVSSDLSPRGWGSYASVWVQFYKEAATSSRYGAAGSTDLPLSSGRNAAAAYIRDAVRVLYYR